MIGQPLGFPASTYRTELVARARRGDRDAFGQLAAADLGRLFSTALLILGSPDLAKDAVQDALLQAWRGLPGLRDVDRFDAWQHRLLVRSCYRLRRRPLARSWDAPDPVVPDSTASVIDRDQMARAFRRLSADQRTALVLRFYLDLPLREVAALLELPEGTVKSRLHRGLSALRGALEADDRNPVPLPQGGLQ